MKYQGFLGLLAVLGASTAQAVKFMPLGDSITEITCWRAYVWDQISRAGLASQVDFVGSMTNNPQNCRASTPNFDLGHEGHSGWKSVDIANNNLQGWLSRFKPDVVNFHLGTNDVTAGTSTDAIINSFTKMVQLMRASNPKMQIIVEKLINLSYAQSQIDAINARIPAWAQGLNSTQSPIYIADCSRAAGYTNAMLRDMVHPTDAGDQLMARQIGPLVIHAIQQVLGGGTPPPGTTMTTSRTSTTTTANPTPTSGGTCASRWGQCGGNGWTGPTCCDGGATCKFSNDWYSQCV